MSPLRPPGAEAPGSGRHPYADFLPKVKKPSRYTGGEYQQVLKAPESVDARVCLAFPDVYEIGMSHLGTKILYGVLNKHPRIACERAFSPWLDCEAELRARRLPLVTLESAEPLAHFDVIGFSLQYELTYTNVLNLLDLAALPLRAAARGDHAPLILAGGPTATHPEPLAPFIDAFFIGEAEEHLPALVLAFASMRREGMPRRERLIRLAAAFPLYVPELYDLARDEDAGFVVVGAPLDPRVPARPKRAWVADINRFPFPDDSPLPFTEAIFDRMAVEIARGCTEGCRFCQAGMIYRPVRERDPVEVMASLVGGVKQGGYDETSLTSLSTADYSCISPLVKTAMATLRDERVSLAVSSLRAYGLNDDLLGEMATMRAGGLTFAPEAGTQRMRDVIAKNVTEEDITASAERVFGRGFQRMKLYFMIGLPTETEVDVRGIAETASRVQVIGRKVRHGAVVTASVSTHVPKPHTPFQWCAMDTEEETTVKQGLLGQAAKALRVELKMHQSFQSHLEGIFARGDRQVADLLERAFLLGCRFDGWDDVIRVDLWDRALEEVKATPPAQDTYPWRAFDEQRYLGTIPVSARLPWDHIDIGLEPDFLLKEYRRALKDRLSPPCGKPYKKLLHPSSVEAAEAGRKDKLICYDCGVACDLGAMKEERLYFLRRMNAWSPPTPAAKAPEAPLLPTRAARSRPTTRLAPQISLRYRLRYTKLGRVVFLGHLDLIRHLPRVFRRAGLEVAYSAGFHPKPELTFAPALGLGVASLDELMDIRLVDDVSPAELIARLQAKTLDGVSWLGAARLGDGDRPLGRVLSNATYLVRLPQGSESESGRSRFLGSEPLIVRREGDEAERDSDGAKVTHNVGPRLVRGARLGRTIDVRSSLLDVQGYDSQTLRQPWDQPLGQSLRERLSWVEDWAGEGRPRSLVALQIRVSQDLTARPREVVEALWGREAAADIEVARLRLASGSAAAPVDPLEIDRLREIADLAVRDETPEITDPTEVIDSPLSVHVQASL